MQTNNNQNKIIIWTIVGLAVIIGGVALYRSHKAKVAEQYAAEQAANTPQTPPAAKPTLAQFIRQGGSYQCNVRETTQGVAIAGKVFFSGGMIRGNFTTNTSGPAVTGSTIVRDNASYTWSSASTEGVKIPLAANGSLSGFVQVGGNTYSWSADQITDYDCSAWTADSAQFTIPSNINFRDLEFKG